MRIGFASIFASRPHVEHLYFVAEMMRQAGHEPRFLTCDAALPDCYVRSLKQTSKWLECPKCMIGGVRSFTGANIASIRSLAPGPTLAPERALALAQSSASTTLRTESDGDTQTEPFKTRNASLARAADIGYGAARAWIERERLDAVVCFNGRMDVLRGIMEAAKDLGTPFVSMERTWISSGLYLIPNENCLSLSESDRLNASYKDKPLTGVQARCAAGPIAARFALRNATEWRAYNLDARRAEWPVKGLGPKILILPSSRNEFQGHKDWTIGWREASEGLDAVMDGLGLAPEDVVLRCHPNWSERIGGHDGALSESYYTQWCKRRGVSCIAAADKASTFSLIEQCDAIVVNGGSAAIEASALGKRTIALGPSTYQTAGFQCGLYGPDEVGALKRLWDQPIEEIRRLALRHCYTMIRRHAQYVDYVSAITPTRYVYFKGADPARLAGIIASGRLSADDPHVAANDNEEREVLAMIADRQWEKLVAPADDDGRERLSISRRPGLGWLDSLRETMPRGDR